MSSVIASEIFVRYASGQELPELNERISDALTLKSLGYEAMLGVDCIQVRDPAQAVREEKHQRINEVPGDIGPLVYIFEDEGMAFAPPGAALWHKKVETA